jgi:Fur family ferric uptake transcriptional regulator
MSVICQHHNHLDSDKAFPSRPLAAQYLTLIQPELDSLSSQLKNKKISVTQINLAILYFLKFSPKPLTKEELQKNIQKWTPHHKTTLFRALKKLFKKGLIQKTFLYGKKEEYYEWIHLENGLKHHHHHITCRSCSQIQTISSCSVESIEKELEKLGHTYISHHLEFFSICPKCMSKK